MIAIADPQHRLSLKRWVEPKQGFTVREAGTRIALIYAVGDGKPDVVADERGRVRLARLVEAEAVYRVHVRDKGIVLERVYWITEAEAGPGIWAMLTARTEMAKTATSPDS